MKPKIDFSGLKIEIFYDRKDKDWVAFLKSYPSVSAFGQTPEEAVAQLRVAFLISKESRSLAEVVTAVNAVNAKYDKG